MTAVQTDNCFWLVWNEHGNGSKKRHTTFDSAYAESQRLAGMNAGAEFFVMKAVAGARAVVDVMTWSIHDPLEKSAEESQ